MYQALLDIGFEIPVKPSGAFYLYADCRFTGLDSETLAERLLEEAGVAVTPGKDFGKSNADKYLRFAYTVDIEKLRDGVERIAQFIERSELN